MSVDYRTLVGLLDQRYPTFARTWRDSHAAFAPVWEGEFNNLVQTVFGFDENAASNIVDGYAEFSTDAVRSQIFFERNMRYKATSYAEVDASCYQNPDFMYRCYLPGMVVSHYVWPHHHRMLRWFREVIMPIAADVKTFCEIGTGCGLYSKEVLELAPGSKGTGYDISQHALDFTHELIAKFGYGDRYGIVKQDIIANVPKTQFDLGLSQEVLEHLEDPAAYLRSMFAMIKPGGYAYVAAALNAGHVDHIYLYRSPDEIAKQLMDAGFEIVARRAELAYAGKPVDITPCHGGFLCRRP